MSTKHIDWGSNSETLSILADANALELQAMIPVPGGYTVSAVQYNGSPLAYTFRWVKGIQYAALSGLSGDYQVTLCGGCDCAGDRCGCAR